MKEEQPVSVELGHWGGKCGVCLPTASLRTAMHPDRGDGVPTRTRPNEEWRKGGCAQMGPCSALGVSRAPEGRGVGSN